MDGGPGGSSVTSVTDRVAAGKALRDRVPREAFGRWSPPPNRTDPIDLLEEQAKGRLPDLLPLRYGRMATSPFAYLRGSAIVMAADLAASPRTGLGVQACGDAHLANFGVFATPERRLAFDVYDFDETLPGPWEWDLARLATSCVVAGRHRSFDAGDTREVVTSMARAYAGAIRAHAGMGYVASWFSGLDAAAIMDRFRGPSRKEVAERLHEAGLHEHLGAFERLTEVVDGHRRIRDAPPLVVRVGPDVIRPERMRRMLVGYRRTVQPDRRHLLERYRFVDMALKVVGIGSVGTRCLVALLEGRDPDDTLLLQVKEAGPSVLERHLGPSAYRHHGQRVVEGQRLMQAASDIFLGWVRSAAGGGRDYYVRQLRDVKGSVDLETIEPPALVAYAEACGAALARAHARSGDAAAISGYLGRGRALGNALASFADAYAHQVERDHRALVLAIGAGRLPVAR